MVGYIHSIQSLGLVDGPGVRCVVFMQGCPLCCVYCHNPDTWDKDKFKLSYSPDQLVKKILNFKEYFSSNGGVTFSGGEPLMQIDFLIETLKLLKQNNIHTCIDTSGFFDDDIPDYKQKLAKLFSYTDLVLLDVKHYSPKNYQKITGKSIDTFNLFVKNLNESGVDVWIRHVVVPNLTDGEKHVEKLCDYAKNIKGVKKIELLPYHTMGIEKYKALNIKYRLEGVFPPSESEMEIYHNIILKKENELCL